MGEHGVGRLGGEYWVLEQDEESSHIILPETIRVILVHKQLQQRPKLLNLRNFKIKFRSFLCSCRHNTLLSNLRQGNTLTNELYCNVSVVSSLKSLVLWVGMYVYRETNVRNKIAM